MIASFGNGPLLKLWEQVAFLPPARRSLSLLAGLSNLGDAVGQLPVGERDRQLLLLRKELFGDRIEGVTQCAQCGVCVELSFSITDVTGEAAALVPSRLVCDAYQVHWRLPTSQDVADLADENVPSRIRDGLLQRCLLEVRHEQESIAALECPEHVIQMVCEAMSQADPFGDTCLDMECPECGQTWKAAFDIGTYLWREIDVWARRLLAEVHHLASIYGWSERDILTMSTKRRRLYLEMVET